MHGEADVMAIRGTERRSFNGQAAERGDVLNRHRCDQRPEPDGRSGLLIKVNSGIYQRKLSAGIFLVDSTGLAERVHVMAIVAACVDKGFRWNLPAMGPNR